MYKVDDVILCSNEAKNTALAIAKASIFNEVNVRKSKSKCTGYFVTSPKIKNDEKNNHVSLSAPDNNSGEDLIFAIICLDRISK